MKLIPLKSGEIVICRSAYCLKCLRNQRPQRGQHFIVYGTDHQTYKFKTCHSDSIIGYTPHLYVIKFPYKKDEHGLVTCLRTCLMEGCGVDDFVQDNGGLGFNFIDGYEIFLKENEVEALIKRWRNTGYELL